MDIISIGPLLISGERLAAAGGIWLFAAAAGLLERWSSRPLSGAAWGALIIGLVAARPGYVAAHWDSFHFDPASAHYVWYGRFSLDRELGAAGACLAIARLGVLAAGIGVAAWMGAGALLAFERPPIPLPKIAATRLEDGKPASILPHTGRSLVINLWASWCEPRLRKMPMLMQAAAARPGVDFIFLNQGEAEGMVRRYIKEQGLPIAEVAIDPAGEAARRLGAAGLPTTVMISADGLIGSIHTGEIARAELTDELDALAAHEGAVHPSSRAEPQLLKLIGLGPGI